MTSNPIAPITPSSRPFHPHFKDLAARGQIRNELRTRASSQPRVSLAETGLPEGDGWDKRDPFVEADASGLVPRRLRASGVNDESRFGPCEIAGIGESNDHF